MENNWSGLSIAEIRKKLAAMDAEAQRAACETLKGDARKGVVALAEKTLRAQLRQEKEEARLKQLWYFENMAYEKGYQAVVGTDEVGRGPLAGPVVAAAVVLVPGTLFYGINDSKKLSEKRREALAAEIRDKALAVAIAEVSPADIDRLNILHAAEKAMADAIGQLPGADYVLVDGQNQLHIDLPCQNIIGGDSLSISIAAASIVAKVYRDHFMVELDKHYPGYGFAKNKGYGTADHYAALATLGPSPIHRRSFRLK
ncbi:MAG: ribonuclease HII [Peptococcaceae bacterium]|nr:ribonuclease HII [Peptococcaceae bacterium]